MFSRLIAVKSVWYHVMVRYQGARIDVDSVVFERLRAKRLLAEPSMSIKWGCSQSIPKVQDVTR